LQTSAPPTNFIVSLNITNISKKAKYLIFEPSLPIISMKHALKHCEENMFTEILSAVALVTLVYLLFQDNSVLLRFFRRLP